MISANEIEKHHVDLGVACFEGILLGLLRETKQTPHVRVEWQHELPLETSLTIRIF